MHQGVFSLALCFMIGWLVSNAHAVTALIIEELPSVMLGPVVSQHLESPVLVTNAGDRLGRLYIVEQS